MVLRRDSKNNLQVHIRPPTIEALAHLTVKSIRITSIERVEKSDGRGTPRRAKIISQFHA